MEKKIKLLCFVSFIAFVVLMISFCSDDSYLMQSVKNENIILPSGEIIYVRASVWGISANHEEVTLSENADLDFKKDYTFYTNEILYKVVDGELIVYAPESVINFPATSFSKVKVIVNALKGYDDVKEYYTNHDKYGLKIISCC